MSRPSGRQYAAPEQVTQCVAKDGFTRGRRVREGGDALLARQ